MRLVFIALAVLVGCTAETPVPRVVDDAAILKATFPAPEVPSGEAFVVRNDIGLPVAGLGGGAHAPSEQPVAGMGAPDPGAPMVSSVPFDGEQCRPGAALVCDCPNGNGGVKKCLDDSSSPSGGSYSECMNCDGAPSVPQPAPPPLPAPAVGSACPPYVGESDGMPVELPGCCMPEGVCGVVSTLTDRCITSSMYLPDLKPGGPC